MMYKIITLALIITSSMGLAQRPLATDTLVKDTLHSTSVDSLLAFAEKHIGKPYGYGSTGPNSFDCSGFVQHVYGRFGVALPHGSSTQGGICDEIEIEDARPGDLIFFNGRKRNGQIGHVAIVHHWEGDQLYIIHATVQAGVLLENMHKSEYFKPRFVKVGRLKQGLSPTLPNKQEKKK
jgi:cell wall-associated NlpC family hydrolase